MKRWILIPIFLAAGVALMMAAAWVVLIATLRIPATSPFRAVLIAGDVLAGVAALVGSVYLALQFAVRVLAEDEKQT